MLGAIQYFCMLALLNFSPHQNKITFCQNLFDKTIEYNITPPKHWNCYNTHHINLKHKKQSVHSRVVRRPEKTQHCPNLTAFFFSMNSSRIATEPVHAHGTVVVLGYVSVHRPVSTPPSASLLLDCKETWANDVHLTITKHLLIYF